MTLPSFNPKRYPELQELLGEDLLDAEKRSLADEAHDQILLKIIHGDLAEGSELKTTQLARDLDMSRTPVIQALARLTAGGIIQQSLNLRAVVRKGAQNWLVDIHRMRQLIEPEAARAAVGQVPEAALADLQMLSADAKPGKGSDWQSAARWFDRALHLTLAECCGNLSMREMLRRCWSYKRLSYSAGTGNDATLKQEYRQHAAMVEALIEGNPAGIGELMEQHLDHAAPSKPGQRIV